MGDVERMLDADDTIHCILKRVLYPGVKIDHFSNSIFYTVVYGQVDSYVEVLLLLGTLGILPHTQIAKSPDSPVARALDSFPLASGSNAGRGRFIQRLEFSFRF
ncbi:hypothetical protein TNCV_175201 [Trichonephila clavipes]|nr:hypothetical protein TNCV_175201 [Trichonephila clavipes]